ncbi:hypothetical protein fHeYen801_126 [Yersinia phage fHe-Yen8-01]|nr:hypothetical protein fHeYen801_126 [Yersinia phage fHe-Yen8-01]
MIKTAKGIPTNIFLKAGQELTKWIDGLSCTTKMKKTGYLSLKVGLRYRLLSKDDGETWLLMTHESYNHEKDRR